MAERMVAMCPNHEILSVYCDQELPSPWKEKMEAHLEVCPACRSRLERYRALSPAGGVCSDAGVEAAKQRLWQNLSSLVQEKPQGLWIGGGSRSLWRRSVSLPLPVAAAAAAVILALAVALTNRLSGPPLRQEPVMADSSGLDAQGFIPASGMNGILQYLSSESADDMVIIRLPESRRFISSGEPVMVKEADYKTRSASNR